MRGRTAVATLAFLCVAAVSVIGCGNSGNEEPGGRLDARTEITTPRPQPTWPTVTPQSGSDGVISAVADGPEAAERAATSTPVPTVTPRPPEIDRRTAYVTSWASCNGRYQGAEYQGRRDAAYSALDRSLHTLDSIVELVRDRCEGVFSSPEAAAAIGSSEWPAPTPAPLPTPGPAGNWFVAGENGIWVMRYVDHQGRTQRVLMPPEWKPPQGATVGAAPTPTPVPKPTNTPWIHGPGSSYATSTPEPTRTAWAGAPTRRPARTRSPEPAATRPPPTRAPVTMTRWPEAVMYGDLGTHASRIEEVPNWAWLAYNHRATADALRRAGWAKDGLTRAEARAAAALIRLVVANQGDDVQALLGMPFLRTVEAADGLAVETMLHTLQRERDTYESLMSSGRVCAGVDDGAAEEIAAAAGLLVNDPDHAIRLLDQMTMTAERGETRSAGGRTIQLSIYRTGPADPGTMQDLADAVRAAETVAGTPLPIGHVVVMVDSRAVRPGSGGTNYGTSFAILETYEQSGHPNTARRGMTLAHETAHYFWSGNKGWFDEGVADLTAMVYSAATEGRAMRPYRPPCARHATIRALEAAGGKSGDSCNYAFGQRLMMGLWEEQGSRRLYAGLARLYEARSNAGSREIGEQQLNVEFSPNETVERWYEHGGGIGRMPAVRQRDGTIETIGGRLESVTARMEGKDVIAVEARYRHDGRGGITLTEMAIGYEDGYAFHRVTHRVTATPGEGGFVQTLYYPGPGGLRRGDYWAVVRHEGKIIGQTTVTVR